MSPIPQQDIYKIAWLSAAERLGVSVEAEYVDEFLYSRGEGHKLTHILHWSGARYKDGVEATISDITGAEFPVMRDFMLNEKGLSPHSQVVARFQQNADGLLEVFYTIKDGQPTGNQRFGAPIVTPALSDAEVAEVLQNVRKLVLGPQARFECPEV